LRILCPQKCLVWIYVLKVSSLSNTNDLKKTQLEILEIVSNIDFGQNLEVFMNCIVFNELYNIHLNPYSDEESVDSTPDFLDHEKLQEEANKLLNQSKELY